MRPRLEHSSHDHAREVLPQPLHGLDDETQVVESRGDVGGVVFDGREVTQPGERDTHQNCLRKRTSFVRR